ncbi:MAG TPA: YbhB/YbcL family Raf kinase inhibitor-like protein, partial [Spirochaetota bacterium]|nr:YbhB/YbcL family Raf kinase inhibitor-like protein [Spirochaetota bacterium]
MGTWVHWVLFNLPADTTELPQAVPAHSKLSNGAVQGMTDFGKPGYGGPCPPGGTHRYFFKIYALDDKIDLTAEADKKKLLQAMEGHILARGQLIGRYQRQ